jgi:hypothetical protein
VGDIWEMNARRRGTGAWGGLQCYRMSTTMRARWKGTRGRVGGQHEAHKGHQSMRSKRRNRQSRAQRLAWSIGGRSTQSSSSAMKDEICEKGGCRSAFKSKNHIN